MANYYLEDGKLVSAKKKKKKENNYILQDDGSLRANDFAPVKKKRKDDDLAPVRKTVKSAPVTPRNKRSTNTSERSERGAGSLSVETTKPILTAERSRKNDRKPTNTFDFFDKGAFSDGYDKWDIAETILGTTIDVIDRLGMGFLDIGEGVVDAGAQLGAGVATLAGNKKKAKELMDFAEQSYVDDAQEIALEKRRKMGIPTAGKNDLKLIYDGGSVEEVSILGEDSGNIIRSVPTLLTAKGFNSASGVVSKGIMGATSFGSGVQEAYQNDATIGEATTYGLISAGADVITESWGGGIKFGNNLKKSTIRELAETISNRSLRTAADLGIDIAGEAGEEVAAEFFKNIGKGLTYASEEEMAELVASPDAMVGYVKAAIGGGVLGGAFNGKKVYDSYKAGREEKKEFGDEERTYIDNQIKKRTSDLQRETAIDEEVERRITNRDKDTNLNDAEKRNIRKTVREEFDRGEIDFSETKLDRKTTKAIEKEIKDDLRSGRVDMSDIEEMFAGEDLRTLHNLKKQLDDENLTEEQRSAVQARKDALEGPVLNRMAEMLSRNKYFAESYRQRLMKGKRFTRAVQDTDTEITKELVESAQSAGMNNTRKMHDLFEYTNKIANDTSTKYGFVNSKQLKDMGYSMKDAIINGMVRVQEDGSTKVLINVDSGKALNTIIGHETTHLLEGTKEYTGLVTAVKEYATMKGEYEARMKAVSELYKNVEADMEKEVTADLVGDYIFTDEQFIQELTKKPNVFQKVYNYIKHAYRMATAGSTEAKQLEKAKRAFEKAYRNMNPEATADTFSISETFRDEVDAWYNDSVEYKKTGGNFKVGKTSDALKSIGVKDQDIYWDKTKVKKILEEHEEMTIDIIKDVPNVIENPVMVMQSKTRKDSITVFGEVYADGMPVLVAMQLSPKGKSGRVMNFSKIASAYGRKAAQSLIDTSDILYIDENKKRTDTWLRALRLQLPAGLTTYGSIGRVTYFDDVVKKQEANGSTAMERAFEKATAKKGSDKFSISDNQGRKLTKGQQEYFENSKARDNEGNLIRLYHQTENEFTVFDTRHEGAGSRDGGTPYGIFLKPAPNDIGLKGKKQMALYANIKNPLVVRDRSELDRVLRENSEYDAARSEHESLDAAYQQKFDEAKNTFRDFLINWRKDHPDAGRSDIYDDPEFNEVFSAEERIVEEWTSKADELSVKSKELLTAYLNEQGYDGIILEEDVGSFGRKTMAYIALSSEQVKNIDNENPTRDHDIRFSLSDSKGRELTEEQQEYFKDSKVRDENGNLKVMYHGSQEAFTVFDPLLKGGKNGSVEGFGIYLTDSAEVAQPYANNGTMYEGYVNITKPATSYEKTIGKSDLIKLIKATCEIEAQEYVNDGEYNTVEEALKDTWISNYVDTYKKNIEKSYKKTAEEILDNNLNDKDIIQEVMLGSGARTYATAYKFYDTLKATLGIDGFIARWEGGEKYVEVAIPFDSNQFKNADNKNPTENPDIRLSLSGNDDLAPVGGYAVYGEDVKVDNNLAPVKATASKTETVEDDLAPVRTIDNDVAEADPSMFEPWPDEAAEETEGVEDADAYRDYVESMAPDYRQGKVKQTSEEFIDYDDTEVPMDKESMRLLTKNMKEVLGLNPMQRRVLKDIIQDYSTGKIATGDDLYNAISDQFSVQSYEVINEELTAVKKALRETPIHVPDSVKDGIKDYFKFRQGNFNKLKLGNTGMEIDDAYEALREVYPGHFPEDVTNIEDQLYHMAEVASMEHSTREEYVLPEERIAEATDFIRESVSDYKRVKKLNASLKWKNPDGTLTRSAVHAGYMQNIKNAFAEKGMDFDSVLANGKNLSTLATVDNTPQRVMEKTFGYKEGQLLSDLTVNKAAENETAAIRWLNSFTNKKNGTLAKLSKKYNIKPFSKEDAAAQKYAEGMHVNQYGDYVEYGDRELETDIKDPQMRANIKAFVADPQLRQIYDETLDAINASRTRNGYPEIPRRNDYFLHFREMDDTFSKIGIPFNPNDIKAKDLPTDINGMTADLKPGQPWFGSSMQRKGVGTTYSLLGGMEKYLTAAKPQIFHIDDIQTLRALRNSIADTYGQAKGLENLDELTDEEAEARIEQVYGSHLSTFAKFLNEEANVMAGKTALIDRGLEGVLGRRAVSFMNTLNTNVARNMIGYNISSSLTNLVSAVQAAAKGSKYDVIKAFSQTAANKIKGVYGQGDGFAEKNSAIIRRKGQDKFYRKPWEKISDTGFIFMSAVDDISTEFIVRTKYNELTRKGMSEEQAHNEAGKWAMRILGDRSFGQMPQIFNSKTFGLVTKFQLEVRNQLDSMFYDTIQEANVSTEEIENATKRNAVKAAKITSTVAQLAVFQHLFGKAFESVAGYNPTFDIIENLMTLFGFDDDEEDDDTFGDNLEQALLGLGEDLPYWSAIAGGGRIPIASALPIEQFVQGKDDYGNDKPRKETFVEALPYYAMPTGYNQIKKTVSGLKMFDKDLPISGSYTDSGNLRFPVEATQKNIAQAAVFGQWANKNAGEYFDGEHAPLKAKQIEEFKDLDLPIADYWKIREGMSGKKKTEEKLSYIDSLDLPVSKKNILANNVSKRKEPIDMSNYGNFDNLEEMDFAVKNPGKYSVSKAVGGYSSYKTYNKALGDIKADKDSNGKTISGSRKEKVSDYINGLDADYGTKIILYKKEYPSDDAYNADIIEYLNGRDDISYDEMKRILEELDFVVDENGNVRW